MQKVIFDIECDDLLDDVKIIHCLSYCFVGEWRLFTIYSKEDIVAFFKQPYTFIGHNIATYDLLVLKKLYNVDVDTFLDTLYLAWYIYPKRTVYGLESFGDTFGIPKIRVDDWKSSDLTLLTLRCETDVKINGNLWVDIENRFNMLYDNDTEAIEHAYKYINFKAICGQDMVTNPLKLDVKRAYALQMELEGLKEAKKFELESVMPVVKKMATMVKPDKYYIKNGNKSQAALTWEGLLLINGYATDADIKEITYVKREEAPNANSDIQKKEWLYSLGWSPASFKFTRNKVTNVTKQVPQIINKDTKELCISVQILADKEPKVDLLRGYGVLSHRIGLVKGLLEMVNQDGYITQEIKGLTSTLRLKHGNVVNLPGVDKPYGSDIRGLFIAPDGYKVFGVDIKNLESKTKDHYIQPLDPKYVEDMSAADYDSHTNISVLAGMMTEDEEKFYKWYKNK